MAGCAAIKVGFLENEIPGGPVPNWTRHALVAELPGLPPRPDGRPLGQRRCSTDRERQVGLERPLPELLDSGARAPALA